MWYGIQHYISIKYQLANLQPVTKAVRLNLNIYRI